jgi:hypothetical protein
VRVDSETAKMKIEAYPRHVGGSDARRVAERSSGRSAGLRRSHSQARRMRRRMPNR